MASFNPVKIFSGSQSTYLAEKIAHHYGKELGGYTCRRFSDGEMSPSFEESVRGCDVFLIQSTPPPGDNLLELLLMVDAARRASAHYVTVVIPYFGYARQDRKDKPRVSIAAKLVANMLAASGADRLMTIDLHAGQIQGFFDFPVDHLEGSSVFVPYIKNLNLENLVIASPDVGGANRARNFAKHFNADIVLCDKHRKRANEIASMQVIGDVEGANVVLFDDLIDTGGTMAKAAQIILDKGALSVRAICTHPVMSGKAYDNIANSVLDELVVADTLPVQHQSDKIKVLSVAELFAKAIGRIRDHESISSLFIRH
ncbi:ribose-phosphate pyrophosphokinase [Spirosoma utsteinense]|uniref:ribose-phosphate diphosphokinase n=1 Tax=Spirosoma utsteinense TaxID=2585773 RepID=A0ABR6W560_9BACT|nr:ribose-phosphate pyrophosphokinase [Spirosoma utsteinense]MBC3785539.1 ribose-phosphate pyrophosphokinase [Spirosoma utsteinense]MBC3791688.1 ribose-phosphate pyrophosphokinase [Spirosoma utsteinense]